MRGGGRGGGAVRGGGANSPELQVGHEILHGHVVQQDEVRLAELGALVLGHGATGTGAGRRGFLLVVTSPAGFWTDGHSGALHPGVLSSSEEVEEEVEALNLQLLHPHVGLKLPPSLCLRPASFTLVSTTSFSLRQ